MGLVPPRTKKGNRHEKMEMNGALFMGFLPTLVSFPSPHLPLPTGCCCHNGGLPRQCGGCTRDLSNRKQHHLSPSAAECGHNHPRLPHFLGAFVGLWTLQIRHVNQSIVYSTNGYSSLAKVTFRRLSAQRKRLVQCFTLLLHTHAHMHMVVANTLKTLFTNPNWRGTWKILAHLYNHGCSDE